MVRSVVALLAILGCTAQAWAEDDLYVILKAKKIGFMNRSGTVVIEPRCDEFWRLGANTYPSFPPLYDRVCSGLEPVKQGDKWGYIDRQGNVVVKPIFDSAERFTEGLGLVEQDRKYGFINEKGDFAIAPQLRSGKPFSNGFTLTSDDTGSGKVFFIDSKGKRMGDLLFRELGTKEF